MEPNHSPLKIDDISLDAATITATPNDPPTNDKSNSGNIEPTQTLLNLGEELDSCAVASTETLGTVEKEPNDTTSNPFPITEDLDTGYVRRQRRSESELIAASDMLLSGETFQAASDAYNIPISTIRFYMVRKGLLKPAPGLKLDEDSTDEECDDE